MLDDLDRALLRLVQRDARQTHDALGREVGLSASAVRRRLARLRAEGVIEAEVAVVAPDVAGVEAIVQVAFAEETVEAYAAFERQMLAAPEVSQCYAVSGEMDFVLAVHAADLPAYYAWAKRVLMSNPSVRRADTSLVWKRVKFSTAVPV